MIEPERFADERGFFTRLWSPGEFASHGLEVPSAHSSLSYNHRRGTLRGMHFQVAPYAEIKLVRCTRGIIYDVIIDLRTDSHTYGQWIGVELSAANQRQLYIPQGFAHGFQTLADESEILYQISAEYHPASARGVRYSDPAFGINWPLDVTVINDRDRDYPLMEAQAGKSIPRDSD